MNNKGFTLIETIIVVAIMAMLAVLLVPNVSGLIKQNKIDSCNNLKESIIRASKLYVSDNRYTFNGTSVTLDTLINEGYLTSPVVNPLNKEEISTSNTVQVAFDSSTKEYVYTVNFINCNE